MESFKRLDEDEADNLYILLRLLGKNYFHNPRPNFLNPASSSVNQIRAGLLCLEASCEYTR